jgi:hypothetical protein
VFLEHGVELARGRSVAVDDKRRQGMACFVVKPLHDHDVERLREGGLETGPQTRPNSTIPTRSGKS